MLPLAAVNLLCALVVAIWLAVLGEWGSIGWGLLASFGAAFGSGVLMMPGLFVAAAVNPLMEKGVSWKGLGFLVAFAGLLWTFAVPSVWGLLAADYFVSHADAASQTAHLFWIFIITVMPWTYMASKEGNEFSLFAAFSVELAAACSLIIAAFTDQGAMTAFNVFVGIMAVGFFANVLAGGVPLMLHARERRRQAIANRQRALEER